MPRYKFIIIILISLALLGMVYSGVSISQASSPDIVPASTAPVSPHIIITSHVKGENELLYLPQNGTALNMYPLWNISILTSQSFIISINAKQVSSGAGPINIQENMSLYKTVDMNVTLGSTVYHYSDISIIGIPPQIGFYQVSIDSSFPGQTEYLSVKPGYSGELTYPDWNISMFASSNTSYKIYENGLVVASGTVLGKQSYDLNITGNSTSVIVVLGTHIYDYKGELVAHVPISQYYKPKPPALVATALDVALSFARGIIIVFLSLISGMFLARKYIMIRKNNEPQRRI